jgi:chemotaxis family two-component system sensor kinase Cph1
MDVAEGNNLESLECDREPIHNMGLVQPHGVLLALQEPELTIVQVSANAEHFFGEPASALLGKQLNYLLSDLQMQKLSLLIGQDENDSDKPDQSKSDLGDIPVPNLFEIKIHIPSTNVGSAANETEAIVKQSTESFNGIFHRTDGLLILELEPYYAELTYSADGFYDFLKEFIANIRKVSSLEDFAQLIASEVRKLTQFDRVMVYKFEPDGSGFVLGEDKASHLEPYLGLRYPASDIPRRARAFYFQNWERIIPNVSYEAVPLVPMLNPLTQEPLDLSRAVLRSVFSGHVEYLKNMEVAASMSISIISEDCLWGLIACHHHRPKYIDYKTRKVGELLGQFASIELLRQQELEMTRYQVQVQSIHEQLRQAFTEDVDFVQQILDRNQSKLLELVNAQGAAIILEDQLTLVGNTPTENEVDELMQWFLQQGTETIFFTDSLSSLYPQAQEFSSCASGVVIASIFMQQKSHHIIWFRPEQVQTVNWGGASSNPIATTADGDRRYTPRKSFALWKETVRNKSMPWQPLEIESARVFRNILMQAIRDASQQLALERSRALENAAAAATSANRAKSQFFAKMSHELRTPLTAILGFTNLLARDQAITDNHKEYIDIISRSGEHLLSLINDVLEMSKIEAGQISLRENSFDLYRLLYSIRDMFSIKAINKGIELNLAIAPNIPQYVYGDEGKLRQILLNLVSNAVKFTNSGMILLNVRRGDVLEFEVSDTGIGIADNDLKTIFEAFKQTDRGRYLQGSGLGLSISLQFARLMGGDITVQSTLGQGSTFLLQAQLAAVDTSEVLVSEQAQTVTGLVADQPTYRILVVEDVIETCLLLANLFESIGLEVRYASNGQEAIAIWQEWQPHLIWMDIHMPIVNGYEATRMIRASSQGKNPKIIALTASAFDIDRQNALAAGCDDFVTKPFTENQLFEKMAQYLGLRYVFAENNSHLPVIASSPLIADSAVRNLQVSQAITSKDLQPMGETWLTQVHRAAIFLDEKALMDLINAIPDTQKAIAATMRQLVTRLEFETIIALTGTD